MATAGNLPCEACQETGRDGELILVDGGDNYTRLRCNKCGAVVRKKMSLLAFGMFMKKRMERRKP